jgi:Fe-Mn family superoxide dismutase
VLLKVRTRSPQCVLASGRQRQQANQANPTYFLVCWSPVYNHDFFWHSLSPKGGGNPTGPIADAIDKSFGSFDNFKKEFSDVAGGHFGSGWAWLVKAGDGSLKVVGTHDASNPLKEGQGSPIITCDVWEHAYYIDYRNARPTYIAAWWNLVNWEFANSNLSK